MDCFTNAAVAIFQDFGFEVSAGAVMREQSPVTVDEVTVLIGLAGGLKGTILFGMATATALQVAALMAGEEFAALDELPRSAVSEMANMVCGKAAADLEQVGHVCSISTPTVVTGKGIEMYTVPGVGAAVPLQTSAGPVTLYVAARSE